MERGRHRSPELLQFAVFQYCKDRFVAIPKGAELLQVDEPGGLVPKLAAEIELVPVSHHDYPPPGVEGKPLGYAEGRDDCVAARPSPDYPCEFPGGFVFGDPGENYRRSEYLLEEREEAEDDK